MVSSFPHSLLHPLPKQTEYGLPIIKFLWRSYLQISFPEMLILHPVVFSDYTTLFKLERKMAIILLRIC